MFVFLFSFFLIVLALSTYIVILLVEKEPDAYTKIGRPHFWFPNRAGGEFILDFILMGNFNDEVTDAGVVALCRALRWLLFGGFAVVVGVGTYVFVSM